MGSAIVRQFGKPSGLLGRLAGLVMRVRASNRERNRRTVELLDVQPGDRVLEIGFGPGLAIERMAGLVGDGRVVGVDHSELMVRQATRRNAKAVAAGNVELLLGSAECLPHLPIRFDKVLAVNVYMFWGDPVAVLRGIGAAVKPGGTVALTFQPRNRGATAEDTRAGAERIAASVRQAGFERVRVEILHLAPVDAACVLGKKAGPHSSSASDSQP
jgi:SAM-dependent methyltransferase